MSGRHRRPHIAAKHTSPSATPGTTESKIVSAEIEVDKANENEDQNRLLNLLVEGPPITSADLKSLILSVDNLDIVAKVFILEGTPYVFSKSPMKYMIFREQVAEKFEVGYQDVCIVGSAKLGYSPSPQKYGKAFAEQSDVDVVIISDKLFDQGSLKLFQHLNSVGPGITFDDDRKKPTNVEAGDWKQIKESVRNYVYQNFNPALLPDHSSMKFDIFQKIRSTSPLFMALEPAVFVSKIRCRIFRNWKAAEDYYANTLRQLKNKLRGDEVDFDPDLEEIGSAEGAAPSTVAAS